MKELQSLDDVFNKKIFRIPDYQRGYAWKIKQLTDFWEDLVSLEGNRLHYTGVLSIKQVPEETLMMWNEERWLTQKRSYVPYYIVDGQQRLTTTSIFLQCLVEKIKSINKDNDRKDDSIYLGSYNLKEIKEKFIVISQPPDHVISTYKFGYETDNPSFQFLRYRIYNEPYPGKVDETFYTLNLENAKKFFTENIQAYVDANGNESLEHLYEKLTQRFMFNLYEIGDDFDVFVAFETMNNRGKALSDLELLKNRLIYLTTLYDNKEVLENDQIAIRKNINDAWKEIYHQLGRNKKHPLPDDDFLRAHWIMYFKYSRKKGDDYIRFLLDEEFPPKKVLQQVEIRTNTVEVVSEVKDDTSDDEDDNFENDEVQDIVKKSKLPITEINKYVVSLKAAARHWYNTYNPEKNPELTSREATLLDRLNRIGIAYFRPLVLASFVNEKITSKQRESLLYEIERFIFLEFRMSRASPTYQSSVINNAARELSNNRKTPESIIESLRSASKGLFQDDGTFKYSYFKDFIFRKYSSGGTGFYGWNGIRYFLFEYEEYLKEYRNQPRLSWENFTKSEKDKVSIEHILPQTPTNPCWSEKFRSFNPKELTYLTGSLGNLLPLSSSVNSSLQNDCFTDKKTAKKDDQGKIIRNGYSNGSHSEQEVASLSDWNSEEILKRGITLLKFMEKRWQIRFGSEKDMMDLLHIDFLEKKIPISENQSNE